MVVMGRVTAPFGVKGWFKVYTLTEGPDNLCKYATWWLRRDGDWREVKVSAAKVQGNTLVAQLEGIDSREAAAAVRGYEIGVPRSEFPAAASGEFYQADLIGLKVVNQDQDELGRVARIVETGANDVLVVADGKQEILIPFIAGAIVKVDLTAGMIAVDWGRDY